ncbi:uncharacterized protein LOC107822932 [Nicotiana tabacum]|uniref:Uncharacterized protein LOC107822932 n=1 Tax=Nicotiana tabacum TaxID=4097 RepID=A0AC58TDE5_TOBAC
MSHTIPQIKLIVLKQILMKLLMMKVKMKSNSQQFREALTEYTVDEHVELDKYVNAPTRVRVKWCAGCPWLLFASYDSRTNDFIVKNYNPLHKCNGTIKNKLCNSKYLAERYKDRIISEPNIRIFKFRELVQKELEVYIGRTVARKTKNIALTQIMGDHVKEFGRILDYRDELLRTNPGSTYIAFLDGCRRYIGFDGCFLKGVCKGQLLVAVCKDENNYMLPLAWAVVEVENTFNWRWFVNLLKNDLELGDGTELTVITDMQNVLDKTISEILPQAEHRMCAMHILANWSKKWRGIERRNCFWRCVRSTYEQELKNNLDHMEKLGDKIVEDLQYYNKERWCKVYFKYFSNRDSVDNNMAKIFNSWILGPRHKTIITILE